MEKIEWDTGKEGRMREGRGGRRDFEWGDGGDIVYHLDYSNHIPIYKQERTLVKVWFE